MFIFYRYFKEILKIEKLDCGTVCQQSELSIVLGLNTNLSS